LKIFNRHRRKPLGLPVSKQIKSWQKANRKMSWNIRKIEFDRIKSPPPLTEDDCNQGFIGAVLFYGFGDDGYGNADAVLTGKLAWDYACKCRRGKTWQCEYVDFNRAGDIRLRPEAPLRPKGFYYANLKLSENSLSKTVAQVRKTFKNTTGLGPEGVQLLSVTHPHLLDMMNEREISFMALADYDVAPYGFNDFFDAMQIFCSNNTMGLGIGNIDGCYPLFGIPQLRLESGLINDQ
jgi:hypothetical protein